MEDYLLTKNVVWLVLSGYELTGLARGGEQLAKLKRNYAKAVELLVELASLQVRCAEANSSLASDSHVGTVRACAGAHSAQMAVGHKPDDWPQERWWRSGTDPSARREQQGQC